MAWELLQSNQSPIHYLFINPKPIQSTMHVKLVAPNPESIWIRSRSFNPFEPNPLAE